MKLTFGERVAFARKRAGLASREALGDKVGAHRNTVGQWENDDALPDGATMIKLPDALGVSGHWLLTGEGEMKPTPPDDAVVKLDIIGKVKDGVIPPATLRVLQRAPGESPAEYAADLQRAIEAWTAQSAVPK